MDTDPAKAFDSPDIAAAAFGELCATVDAPEGGSEAAPPNLHLVVEIPVRITAELGQTSVTIKELLSFAPGSVVELQRLAGEPADLMVNGVLIGKGDVVVVNENYGLRITELVSSVERIKQLAH